MLRKPGHPRAGAGDRTAGRAPTDAAARHQRADRVAREVARVLTRLDERVVLAVSGGLDSMVLLHAAVAAVPHQLYAVATFDHGTGPAATAAASLVGEAAGAAGVRVIAGRGSGRRAGEAGWRAERWDFLREAARGCGARAVATAHTADDQVETVAMRILRGAGARGLAGLYAPGPIVRPLLRCTRTEVAAYAARHGVRWVDDPSNRSLVHLRNRLRHELLPALRAACPGFDADLLGVARRAARWRRDVERLVDEFVLPHEGDGVVAVAASALDSFAADELAVLWPAIAARAGVVLDRRGTTRAAAFTMSGTGSATVPLSGGARLSRQGGRFLLRRASTTIFPETPLSPVALVAGDDVRWGRFHFRPRHDQRRGDDAWTAEFDVRATLSVRAWIAGDRMPAGEGGRARRVKRFFADARVPADDRRDWPVVVADGTIAWIPGVRRSNAATVRPGRPGVRYECDRYDG